MQGIKSLHFNTNHKHFSIHLLPPPNRLTHPLPCPTPCRTLTLHPFPPRLAMLSRSGAGTQRACDLLSLKKYIFLIFSFCKNILSFQHLEKLDFNPRAHGGRGKRYGPRQLQVLQCQTAAGHDGWYRSTCNRRGPWWLGSVCFQKIVTFLWTQMKINFIQNL
jgi:hypothetical protein